MLPLATLSRRPPARSKRTAYSSKPAERTGDVWLASTVYTSLGNCARAAGDLDAALAWHERSARIKKRIDDPRGLMISLHNQAEVLGNQGKHEQAEGRIDGRWS